MSENTFTAPPLVDSLDATPAPAAFGGKFAEYQQRAALKARPPVIFGADEGFDPPIVIAPANPERMDAMNRVIFDKDKLTILMAGALDEDDPNFDAHGRKEFDRLWAVIGQMPIEVYRVLFQDVWDQLFGKGAANVPGGSKRS
ncbi:hypothetical protein G8767_17065 [Rhodococcus sp. IC4_135]|uniref:hypothetical protein n=1 Tax=Rhodococcus sp. IC4_135 TaxID=2715537 RepID=UPI0014229B11|nr:hypothetical protein [Rhodococcus sp. IC4_135]